MHIILVEEYVSNLKSNIGLLDKLCRKDYHNEEEGENIYPSHLTIAQIHQGIKSGKLLQGTFYASRENFLEGSVNVEGSEQSVNKNLIPDV